MIAFQHFSKNAVKTNETEIRRREAFARRKCEPATPIRISFSGRSPLAGREYVCNERRSARNACFEFPIRSPLHPLGSRRAHSRIKRISSLGATHSCADKRPTEKNTFTERSGERSGRENRINFYRSLVGSFVFASSSGPSFS